MKRYKITIEETQMVDESTTEYQKTADTGNPRDGGALYEYVPVKRLRSRETKIFEQTVEDLDIQGVIRAVNGI